MFPVVVGQSPGSTHCEVNEGALWPNNAKVMLRFRAQEKAVEQQQLSLSNNQSKLQLGIQSQGQKIAEWLLLWQDQALR